MVIIRMEWIRPFLPLPPYHTRKDNKSLIWFVDVQRSVQHCTTQHSTCIIHTLCRYLGSRHLIHRFYSVCVCVCQKASHLEDARRLVEEHKSIQSGLPPSINAIIEGNDEDDGDGDDEFSGDAAEAGLSS